MAKVRVGVIGAGSWAVANHLPALVKRSDVELLVVQRPERDLAEAVRRKFGAQHAVTDYRQVLDYHPEVVLICSPPKYHFQHAGDAIKAGCHVLCEKPFTLDPAQAWQLDHLAQKQARHLVVSYGWNYQQMVVDAKKLLWETGLGTVESMMIHMASPTRELLCAEGDYPDASQDYPPAASTWADPQTSGGGYAQAQLTHALGIALWLTELSGESVFAQMDKRGAPVDLHDALVVRYRGGALGTVFGASGHRGANKHQVEVRIFGSNGQLTLDLERELVWLFRTEPEQVRLSLSPDAGSYQGAGPTNAIVDLALAKPNAVNNSPPSLAARVVEILAAAYRSVRSRQLEAIMPSEGDLA